MLYAIIWQDVVNSLALRQSVRGAHLQRINVLIAEGRLVVGGPFPAVDAMDPGSAGFTGSLIIADFPSQMDAENWIADDPYMTSGVISSLTVKPFIQAVP